MADLTITNAVTVNGGVSKDYLAGATVAAGKPVYLTSGNVWALAGCTTATLAGGVDPKRVGFALHAATSGQPLAVQESGNITLTTTLTVGTLYVVSATAGLVAPITDLATTNKVNILGIATTATNLDMSYKTAYAGGYSGVAIP